MVLMRALRGPRFASLARMTFSDVPSNAFLQFIKSARRFGVLGKQFLVDLLGSILPGPADNNCFTLLVPFQDRTWADSELSANFQGD